MDEAPKFLSPASPSELLHYIVTYHAHPTTLLICSRKADFLSSLIEDVRDSGNTDVEAGNRSAGLAANLLAAPLFQVAVARHIRVLFIPTVTHLRSYLSVFSPATSKVTPPPLLADSSPMMGDRYPLLLVYGILELHRDTSEWSAQGIGSSVAALVETAHGNGFQIALTEPCDRSTRSQGLGRLLNDEAPVLSGGARRPDAGWTGRTVTVRRIMARWFQFRAGPWDEERVGIEEAVADKKNRRPAQSFQ